VRFADTQQGVFYGGNLYPMSSGKDFLLFPPLTVVERFRLAFSILRALQVRSWQDLEQVRVDDWLIGLGGQGVFDKLWKPLLKAKFDGQYHDTPATYIWSRLKRTSSPKSAAGQKDRMGYFIGSYKVLVDRLVERIEAAGSSVRVGTKVQEVFVSDGRAAGLIVDGAKVPLDAVVVTTPLPVLSRLVPEPYRASLQLPPSSNYLGVVCGLMLLDRSLTPYYTLNIAEDSIPFTGLIETTTVIAPEHVGGFHLVYLPKYVTANSPYGQFSDADLRSLYLTHLKRMFPAFDEAWIRHLFVFRERFVEPLHQVGHSRPIVPIQSALPGLFVLNNGQIYPDLTNCQASVRHAQQALPIILNDPHGLPTASSGRPAAAPSVITH
jgi:protoporphyrinogen oxidase